MTPAATAHRARQVARILRRLIVDGPQPLRIARAAMRNHGAIQRTWELQSLVGDVRRLRPGVVVEIGTHRGGTLACWAVVSAPNAHLVSIDLPSPSEGMGTTDRDLARVRSMLRDGRRLTGVRADSHLVSTRQQVEAALGGQSVDLLWIDGDHSDAGVRQDFSLYAPLVRPGGLIAFHDINESAHVPGNQVHRFWRELTGRYRTREYIDQDWPGGGMGIGILEWRPAGSQTAGEAPARPLRPDSAGSP
jgi:predicted O-methyltransferase YrrM